MPTEMIPGATRPASGEPARKPNPLYSVAMACPYAIAAGLVGLLVYSHLYGEPFRVSIEDGFIEWATVVSFALCGLLAAGAAVTKWSLLSRAQKVLVILFAVVAFAAVGEEISWGQRYFGFKPPESMKSGGGGAVQMGHNDVTVHNLSLELWGLKLSIGGVLFGVFLFVALFLHGVWLPLKVRRGSAKATGLIRKLGLFLPPLHLGVLLVVSAVFFHYRKCGGWEWRYDSREFKELIVPAVYVFVMLHAYFRERKSLNTAVTAGTIALMAAGFALSVVVAMR